MRKSMQVIADIVGCSRMTISRALRNDPCVNRRTREKILSAAKKTGYNPRQLVENSAGLSRSITVAFFNPRHDPRAQQELLSDCLRGIADELNARRYKLALYLFDDTYGWNKVRSGLFDGTRPDGVIFMLHVPPEIHMQFCPTMLITEAEKRRITHVQIGNETAGSGPWNQVYKDDQQGAWLAVNHLLKLGHRRIGFVTREPRTYPGFQQRMAGYRQALEDYHVPFNSDYVFRVKGMGLCIDSLPQVEKILKLKPRPTALFAVADHLAINVMEALKRKGIRIPEDMAVVGYDNIPGAQAVRPALTTVDTCREEQGRQAARLVMELINSTARQRSARVILVPSKLVIRESCGADKTNPPAVV